MSRKPYISGFAILLAITLGAPAVFFIAPPKTSAQVASIASAASCLGLINAGASIAGEVVADILSVPVSDMITHAQTTITAWATTQDCITTTILMPLARLLARIVLQQITASTINWINGNNGTGQPSYVQNLSLHLQSVGDSSALAFFAQIGRNSNSPFAAAITSSLRLNYFQQTSLAGFWSANMNTLARSSPNVNSFLAGNWSQGGAGAWFALTTQTQNNPYTFYQASQSQLASVVAGATNARQQELGWGQGFLSWCGGNTTSTSGSCVAVNGACPAGCVSDDSAATGCSGTSVSPQAPCTNPDGTPAQALTPGSIIHEYTQKAVVDSGISQLISAQDLDQALGAIITALGRQILGVAGGLFGASQPSASRPAFTTQLQGYSASNESGAASGTSIVQTKLAQIGNYTTAWNTIATAADTASTTVATLASVCTTAATTAGADSTLAAFVTAANAQAATARTAITTEIAPVLTQARAAPGLVANTTAFALRVQSEAAAANSVVVSTAASAITFSNDVQTLVTMPPSVSDVVAAQQNAQAFGGARANPSGSLVVSGGSLVDQMSLIGTNATALQSTVCNPDSSLYVVVNNS